MPMMRPNMEPEDLRPWLGPAWDQLQVGHRYRLLEEVYLIDARYSDDEADLREAAMNAAVQYLLGETDPMRAGEKLRPLRAAARLAEAEAKQVAVMAAREGMSEHAAAEAAGINRMTLRGLLGKPHR